jgi:hypothetical protein
VTTFSIKRQQPTQETVSDVVSDMQSDLAVVMQQLNQLPSSKMTLLTNIPLTTTVSLVAHNLGYQARGFFVVDKTASVDVYRDTTATNIDPLRFIALRTASGSATVSLICF